MSDPPKKNIEAMRQMGPAGFAPPIAKLIGMRAVSFDEGSTVLELDADGRHANPIGTLHGGVLCDLADLAMARPATAPSSPARPSRASSSRSTSSSPSGPAA